MSDMRTMVAELLNCRPVDLASDAGVGKTPGWDSFAQLNIMLELERRYRIPITDETIHAYSNLAAIDHLSKERG
jgi:acyl carrier protein